MSGTTIQPRGTWRSRFTKNAVIRYALAAAGGLMLAAAYPRMGLAGLAWIAPAVMLAAGAGHSAAGTFRVGYVAGMAFFLASLYWLLLIPMGGAPFSARLAPIAGWLALSAYIAVYPALWVWLCWRLFPASPAHAGTPGAMAQSFLATRWRHRALWALSCAAVWVALEMVRSRLFTGFPWNLLGVSQYRLLPLIQVSSITGVHGVSFLVAWFSVGLFCTGVALLRLPSPRWLWLRELILPLAVVTVVVLAGTRNLLPRGESSATATMRIALIQPNIPQEMIWADDQSQVRFEQLLDLSRRALQEKPELLVWPEAAVPGLLRFDPSVNEPIRALAASNRIWMIIGADDLQWREGPRDKVASYDSYNSSFLITPAGEILESYRKRRLVIFGEYVPLRRWLPFMKYLTPIGGSFSSGTKPVPFTMAEVRTSVLICFEDVFPHLAREYVDPDTDFLLNLTNNGWFGESAAQWQHAAAAVFRAVENGLPLVRCANNGLTCWVDERGAIHNLFFPKSPDVYQAGYKIVDVPLQKAGGRQPTFYQRRGDTFGWSVSLLAVTMLVQSFWRRKAQLARP